MYTKNDILILSFKENCKLINYIIVLISYTHIYIYLYNNDVNLFLHIFSWLQNCVIYSDEKCLCTKAREIKD